MKEYGLGLSQFVADMLSVMDKINSFFITPITYHTPIGDWVFRWADVVLYAMLGNLVYFLLCALFNYLDK